MATRKDAASFTTRTLARAATPAADQYALFATLYRGLFGVAPFGGGSHTEILASATHKQRAAPIRNMRVPRRLRAALDRGLELDPAARFESVDAAVAELEALRARTRATAPGSGIDPGEPCG